ncbi:variant SH3 domain-containing protein [Ditylenchus destructor]|uniref:Variant SH3 domain-containing protein n=1 Tax=Ditylenchus destructor TaxID=166010 RepID=A0AAD4MZ93_9BILA|nr:variant SH3 domain-containing protein [Ditylenchus destructor]
MKLIVELEGRPYGFRVAKRNGDGAVFVSQLVTGGKAAQTGVQVGDIVESIQDRLGRPSLEQVQEALAQNLTLKVELSRVVFNSPPESYAQIPLMSQSVNSIMNNVSNGNNLLNGSVNGGRFLPYAGGFSGSAKDKRKFFENAIAAQDTKNGKSAAGGPFRYQIKNQPFPNSPFLQNNANNTMVQQEHQHSPAVTSDTGTSDVSGYDSAPPTVPDLITKSPIEVKAPATVIPLQPANVSKSDVNATSRNIEGNNKENMATNNMAAPAEIEEKQPSVAELRVKIGSQLKLKPKGLAANPQSIPKMATVNGQMPLNNGPNSQQSSGVPFWKRPENVPVNNGVCSNGTKMEMRQQMQPVTKKPIPEENYCYQYPTTDDESFAQCLPRSIKTNTNSSGQSTDTGFCSTDSMEIRIGSFNDLRQEELRISQIESANMPSIIPNPPKNPNVSSIITEKSWISPVNPPVQAFPAWPTLPGQPKAFIQEQASNSAALGPLPGSFVMTPAHNLSSPGQPLPVPAKDTAQDIESVKEAETCREIVREAESVRQKSTARQAETVSPQISDYTASTKISPLPVEREKALSDAQNVIPAPLYVPPNNRENASSSAGGREEDELKVIISSNYGSTDPNSFPQDMNGISRFDQPSKLSIHLSPNFAPSLVPQEQNSSTLSSSSSSQSHVDASVSSTPTSQRPAHDTPLSNESVPGAVEDRFHLRDQIHDDNAVADRTSANISSDNVPADPGAKSLWYRQMYKQLHCLPGDDSEKSILKYHHRAENPSMYGRNPQRSITPTWRLDSRSRNQNSAPDSTTDAWTESLRLRRSKSQQPPRKRYDPVADMEIMDRWQSQKQRSLSSTSLAWPHKRFGDETQSERVNATGELNTLMETSTETSTNTHILSEDNRVCESSLSDNCLRPSTVMTLQENSIERISCLPPKPPMRSNAKRLGPRQPQHFHLPSYRFQYDDPRPIFVSSSPSTSSCRLPCYRCGFPTRQYSHSEIDHLYNLVGPGQVDAQCKSESLFEKLKLRHIEERLEVTSKELDAVLEKIDQMDKFSNQRSKSSIGLRNSRTHNGSHFPTSTNSSKPHNSFSDNFSKDDVLQRQKMEKLCLELEDQLARRHGYLPSSTPSLQNNFERLDQLMTNFNGRSKSRSSTPISRSSSMTRSVQTCTALYSFIGETARELSFNKGEVIRLHRQIDENWLEGERNGKVGIFPASYVQIAEITSKDRLRALYQFQARNPNELSLNRGEILHFIRTIDAHWIEGRNSKGKVGIFPKSYVLELDANDIKSTSRTISFADDQSSGSGVPDRPKTPKLLNGRWA